MQIYPSEMKSVSPSSVLSRWSILKQKSMVPSSNSCGALTFVSTCMFLIFLSWDFSVHEFASLKMFQTSLQWESGISINLNGYHDYSLGDRFQIYEREWSCACNLQKEWANSMGRFKMSAFWRTKKIKYVRNCVTSKSDCSWLVKECYREGACSLRILDVGARSFKRILLLFTVIRCFFYVVWLLRKKNLHPIREDVMAKISQTERGNSKVMSPTWSQLTSLPSPDPSSHPLSTELWLWPENSSESTSGTSSGSMRINCTKNNLLLEYNSMYWQYSSGAMSSSLLGSQCLFFTYLPAQWIINPSVMTGPDINA